MGHGCRFTGSAMWWPDWMSGSVSGLGKISLCDWKSVYTVLLIFLLDTCMSVLISNMEMGIAN